MAVKAKMDAIVNIVYTDDEDIAMIKEANIPIIPTVTHRSTRDIEELSASGEPEFITDKRIRLQETCFENFKRIHQAGVKMATGIVHGLDWCAFEMEIKVSLGMTPMEAIQTATKNAAETVKLDKITGTLDVGKYADVIAVNGDPSADVRVLRDR
ncbi:amidohydrolase family protein [Chloroflexota bacterium]